MADVRGGVVVRRSADEAVLGIGGVLERLVSVARVVEAEDDARVVAMPDAREVADLRVVAVHDEHRAGKLRDRGPPAAGEDLQLAVAVELVAKEVAEAERARPYAPRDLGE